ncbi:hypothetical protein I5L45_22370 [Serratia marcescens]|uniref:hypothetical protein n=1 Tax=Serratia nevei TaxID=2703794 RepID=UPI0018D5C44E|nr:hypothetical protein [Serratia marcescens]
MTQDNRAIGNNPAVPKNNRSAGFPGHLEARAPIEAPIVITLYFGPVAGRGVIRRYVDRAHDFSCRRGGMMVVGTDSINRIKSVNYCHPVRQ